MRVEDLSAGPGSGRRVRAHREGTGIGSTNGRAYSGRGQMGHGRQTWTLARRLRVYPLKVRFQGGTTTNHVILVLALKAKSEQEIDSRTNFP